MTMAELDKIDGDEPCGDVAVVELGVTGGSLDPSALTIATGLAPSRAWRKGDVYQSRSGQEIARFQNLWVLERRGTNVEEVAKELLAAVEPRLHLIREAASRTGSNTGVGIWWDPAARQGGFTTSSDVMRRLAELGERIDVYFPG